jgi:hypothetical protein
MRSHWRARRLNCPIKSCRIVPDNGPRRAIEGTERVEEGPDFIRCQELSGPTGAKPCGGRAHSRVSHPGLTTERVGFEPTEALTSTVFETAPIDHSGTSPGDRHVILPHASTTVNQLD